MQRRPVLNEIPEELETARTGTRKMASESTPVEHGNVFAPLTGILNREEMSELCNILIEKPAIEDSPTDFTMMPGEPGNTITTLFFPETLMSTLVKIIFFFQ